MYQRDDTNYNIFITYSCDRSPPETHPRHTSVIDPTARQALGRLEWGDRLVPLETTPGTQVQSPPTARQVLGRLEWGEAVTAIEVPGVMWSVVGAMQSHLSPPADGVKCL